MESTANRSSETEIEASPTLAGAVHRLKRGIAHLRHRPMSRPFGPPGHGDGNRCHCRHAGAGRQLGTPSASGCCGGGRGRPGGRRISLGPAVETALNTVSTDDAYLNGDVTLVAPGSRPGGPGPGQGQQPREEGGLASPARSRAVPVAGRHQESGRDQRRGRPQGRQRPSPGHSGTGPQLEVGAPDGDRKGRRPGRPPASTRGGPEEQRGEPRSRRADFTRADTLFARRAISREEFDQRREAHRTAKAAVTRPSKKSPRPASPWACRRPREGRAVRRPQRPQPDVFRCPQGAGRAGPEPRAGRPPPTRCGLDAKAGPGRIHQPRQGRQSRSDPGGDRPRGPGGPPGRGQADPGQARPRPGGAEPPLLRHRQRDRRRRHQQERQPRQQRPGGAGPHGRPLADRDLDRRELQGDAARGPAHRPAGALRGRHVRRPA